MADDSAPETELRRWLAAIGRLTAAVNAGYELKVMLDLVAETARELLGLDFCGVMVPAPDASHLAIVGGSGLPDQYISKVNDGHRIRLESDPSAGAPASRAFLSGQPCAVADVADKRSMWADVAREQGYRSILAVPMITSVGVVGTLNSYRSTEHQFTPHEIERLELLAEHAAVALSSARIVNDLREQHALALRSDEIHQRLQQVAMHSGGLTGIAKALHDLLECHVLIQDRDGRVLAATSTDLPHLVAGSAEPLDANATEPSRILVARSGPHAVVDVLLEGAKLATVWLLGWADRADALGIRAAEHASNLLSLEMLRQRTAVEVEQTLRGDLLADLVSGEDPDSRAVRDRASLMGHDLGARHHVLVARLRAETAGLSTDELNRRTTREALRLTSHLKPRPLIAPVRGVIVALWPEVDGHPSGEDLIRRAARIAESTAQCIVAMVPSARDGIPGAVRVGRGVLTMAALGSKHDGVVKLEELGVAGILLQTADPAEMRRYAERSLGPLRDYDAAHGTELVSTLRSFLDCDLDRRAAGTALMVHPNTVSQRLRRVESLTGLDLRSLRSAVDARAALLLLDLSTALDSADLAGLPA